MIELIRSRFENKSVVLLGFGREGQATYAVLRSVFPEAPVAIADASESVCKNPLIAGDKNITFITGDGYLEKLSSFDIIVRSPGIPIWNTPISPSRHFTISPSRQLLTSQTDLFLRAYSRQVIGVTGTKGKSTTSSLIHHILRTAGKDSILVGNIGNPAFHYINAIKPETIIVFELSSHQLEYIAVAPHISIFLNLFQEHLDAYSSFHAYQLAKANITKYQQKGDFLVFNTDDPLVVKQVAPYLSDRECYPFSLQREVIPGGFLQDGFLCFAKDENVEHVWKIHQDRFLRGEHNLKNIQAAMNVAGILGISKEDLEDGIATFKGLEHRLEYVGEYGSIHFYNDSIATIPEACMEAVKSVPLVDTLIAGGFDRGIDYLPLAEFLCRSSVRNLILLGAAGKRIGEFAEKLMTPGKNLFYINRFDDFKKIAFHETRPGYACLLSPAAASYDEFKNFEERGNRFRELVMERW
ncbi:MAG: UDP-N-acetylmuramoyl-L-alanine--D-glutamate ligase [Bacteroidota bacterium]